MSTEPAKAKFRWLPREELLIAARIAYCRRSRGHTQNELAVLLGITRDQMASIETGRVTLPFDLALKIADALAVNLRWLAEGMVPAYWYVAPDLRLTKKIKPGESFIVGYNQGLREFFRQRFNEIETCFRNEQSPTASREIAALLNVVGDTAEDRERLTSYLWPVLKETMSALPPLLQYELAMQIARRIVEFKMENKVEINAFIASLSPLAREAAEKRLAKDCQSGLDNQSGLVQREGVKRIGSLPDLLAALRERTKLRGQKAALARHCNVTRQAVDQWLSDSAKPSAEATFKAIEWVQSPERQK